MMNLGSVVNAFLRAVVVEDPKVAVLGIRQRDNKLWLVASRVRMVPATETEAEHVLAGSEDLIHQSVMPLHCLPFVKQTVLDMGHGLEDTLYGVKSAQDLYDLYLGKKVARPA